MQALGSVSEAPNAAVRVCLRRRKPRSGSCTAGGAGSALERGAELWCGEELRGRTEDVASVGACMRIGEHRALSIVWSTGFGGSGRVESSHSSHRAQLSGKKDKGPGEEEADSGSAHLAQVPARGSKGPARRAFSSKVDICCESLWAGNGSWAFRRW